MPLHQPNLHSCGVQTPEAIKRNKRFLSFFSQKLFKNLLNGELRELNEFLLVHELNKLNEYFF